MNSPDVALQLWTIRDLCEAGFADAMREVSAAGYRYVEPYDFYGQPASRVAAILGDHGLGALSSHVSLDDLEADPARVMDFHEEIGCRTIICPWLDEQRRADPAVFEKTGDSLARMAPLFHERGFRFGYHNHEFEFNLLPPPDGIRRILSRADPGAISIQFDTYWAAFCGLDPVEYMRGLGDRLFSVHLKDGHPSEGKFTPTGSGSMNMRAIIRAARELNVASLVVEQDEHDGPPAESIRRSLDFVMGELSASA